MSYKSSPRPTFDGPAHIPFSSVQRHLWGDQESGRVADWIYVSSREIHQLVFGMSAGEGFRHSDSYRTIFAADELLYVLEGEAAFNNPETGEVHLVRQGESVFFRRDTWHHCFNVSAGPLRVVEFFAPPPSQGASGSYAQSKPNLLELKYAQDAFMKNWPKGIQEARAGYSMQVVREPDYLWRLEGANQQFLVGILAATEHLTVGKAALHPGNHSDLHAHAGEESLYLISGQLNIHVPDNEGQRWFELHPKDGFYLPEGTQHAYHNIGEQPAEFLFGTAPGYFSSEYLIPDT